ncbi:MAG TPA: alpha-amylase family glycosyl hydrolase [Anaerolineales bacterium]|nr:alpha-amylase family glycosyl hydrolase [Anaerolineales bacterium]
MSPKAIARRQLDFLYGRETAGEIWPDFERVLDAFRGRRPDLAAGSPTSFPLTEKDAVLITYADQFRRPGEPPLRTLGDFLGTHLDGALTGVHLLPFFPYSSDDGFSVIDYHRVDPEVGDWDDVAALGNRYRLMFDAVVNHVSRESDWFRAYLAGKTPYRDFFIEADPGEDLSAVVRPRALPLLTRVQTSRGPKHVWTTFSDDQVDLAYAEPAVLLEMTDLLLFYIEKGAEIIRLDAIAYLWKELGTSCIHLPETHAVVKFWRAVLDDVAPHVVLITETNVPHEENVSYFGETGDEARMVYQFPLAPLVLHSFLAGDARALTTWAADLEAPPEGAAFFNFIASHDGVGVRPAEGLLEPEQVRALAERTLAHGGQVSYRDNEDGTQSAYELNITLFDFLNDPGVDEPDLDIARFLASQAILLSLAGVPGIYVHSLLGSRNCLDCVRETGRARSINREKFDYEALSAVLSNPGSHPARVLDGCLRMLRIRSKEPAFHPAAAQQVLALHPGVFAVLRGGGGPGAVLCLANVTAEPLDAALGADLGGRDLLSGEAVAGRIALAPYQVRWVRSGDEG